MDQNRSRFDRFMPQSTFGVTLMTIAIIILVLGFFVRGVHLVSVDGKLPEGYVRLADRHQQSFDDLLPSDSIALSDEVLPTDSKAGTRIKLWGHYGENRANPNSTVVPGYIASLVRTSDCRWSDDADAPLDGAQFRVGQTLDIAAGLVEIAFACGAKAILEGPAVLELQSEKSGALRVGRMTADVPDEVEGFTVTTPVVQLVSISKAERESVAKLTETVDCLWEEDSAATKKGAFLRPGHKLKLAGGLAEISFACGAKIILQGPANLEIESTKTAILHSGKLTADVPDDLEGFKIRTALAEVISLPADSQLADGKTAPESKAVSAEGSDGTSDTVALKPGERRQIEAPAKKPDVPAPPASSKP
ncbi:MAG: hypothetical protein KKE86_17355 [Planctomycetes bacterium]|nr:hypothetical protein [Planctomycetota bacterium]